MSNIKFSELPELLNFNKEQIFVPVVDTTDKTQATTGTNKKAAIDKVVANASLLTQGYYGVITAFYFDGSPTETVIDVDQVDQWVDVNFTVHAVEGFTLGEFDNRPLAMKQADATGWDEATGLFNLEGLETTAFCSFRASMTFEPEEDEGQLDARLEFQRHSGTTPSDPFPIEDVVATMSQGASIEYNVEPFLTFFVGDTIDTNGAGDAGKCKFQIKSSVAGIVRMRALTWYINK